MDNYRVKGKIGEGCFGTVYNAVHLPSGGLVALKRVPVPRLDEGLPNSVVREILALERLRHENIIRVKEIFPSGSSIIIVTEKCALDLQQLLSSYSSMERMPLAVVKGLLFMLLRALRFLHDDHHILHRDIKPSNCLIGKDGTLKLSDFGLTRVISRDKPMTHEVSTRWYRAPELLFGERHYDGAVDVWGVGCIFAELLSGCGNSVLFSGDGDIDQISRIFTILGTPSETNWPCHTQLPDWGKIIFSPVESPTIDTLFCDAPRDGLDLLKGLLRLDPKQRLTAAEALRHTFFWSPPLPALLDGMPNAAPSPPSLDDFLEGRASFPLTAVSFQRV